MVFQAQTQHKLKQWNNNVLDNFFFLL